MLPARGSSDRKSTRLNSSHTEIYTLSLHDALPILSTRKLRPKMGTNRSSTLVLVLPSSTASHASSTRVIRSEEHTSELQSHRDLHSFPTRRSSDLEHAQTPSQNGHEQVIDLGFGFALEHRQPCFQHAGH